MISGNCFIGIDLGTSGCRAVVIDEQAELVDQTRASYPDSQRFADGRSEQQPNDWWLAVQQVLSQLKPEVKANCKALALDGTSGTLLITDDQGNPLSVGMMYDDTRGADQLARLQAIAPKSAAVHSASSALAKLMHLASELSENSHYALHQADWIVGKLTGQFGVSDENNCLKLGYEPITQTWPDWIGQCDFNPKLLPKVFPVGSIYGKINAKVSKALQLPTNLQIIAGTTDSNAATLAAGISEIGDAVTSLGSTLVLKLLSDKPIFAPEYGIYSHRIQDKWLVGGASNTGGSVLRQFFSNDQLLSLSQLIDPAKPTGLDYYPLPKAGERFPINDANLAPKLTPRPDQDHLFLQGIFEGIATIEAHGYQLLETLGAPCAKRIVSSGGGAKNPVFQTIRALQTKTTISLALQSEAAFGSASIARGYDSHNTR